jgi:hypothetical protein
MQRAQFVSLTEVLNTTWMLKFYAKANIEQRSNSPCYLYTASLYITVVLIMQQPYQPFAA